MLRICSCSKGKIFTKIWQVLWFYCKKKTALVLTSFIAAGQKHFRLFFNKMAFIGQTKQFRKIVPKWLLSAGQKPFQLNFQIMVCIGWTKTVSIKFSKWFVSVGQKPFQLNFQIMVFIGWTKSISINCS